MRCGRNIIGTTAPIAVEESQVNVLTTRCQGFREIQLPVQPVVPPTGKHHGRSIPRHGNIENRQALDGVPVLRRDRERRRPPPVVTHDEEFAPPKDVVHQAPDVLRQGLLVIPSNGPRGIAQAAQIRGDNEIIFGQPGNDVTPHVPGLRPSVQQQDRGSFASGDVMEPHVAQIGEIMLELFCH